MGENLPLVWRKMPERYRLVGSKCLNCGRIYFPRRKICPHCRRKGKIVDIKMPEKGKIYSFSEVHSAPPGFENELPYFVAIVELQNGIKLFSMLADSPRNKIRIGAPVKMVFRKITENDGKGIIAYGYKFKVL